MPLPIHPYQELLFMHYHQLPRGNENISEIGLGLGIMNSVEQGAATIARAIDLGVNYFDCCCAYEKTLDSVRLVFKEQSAPTYRDRSKALVQLHLGASFKNGAYAFTRNLTKAKEVFLHELEYTGLGYADFGMFHCVDEQKDLDTCIKNGWIDTLKDMKAQGLIRHLGFSTHTPNIAFQLLEMNCFDLFMFSINAAFDYAKGDYSYGEIAEREKLYRTAASQHVAISVMKPFAGGQLLRKDTSPIGVALTPVQCIQYVLDRTAVITTLPGASTPQEIEQCVRFSSASEEEKDYSILSKATPSEAMGRCVYCNHCAPCPKKINVGLVNKYYDLALLGDDLARQHYLNLDHHASECNDCGHCDKRCPFKVKQQDKMHEIAAYFGV